MATRLTNQQQQSRKAGVSGSLQNKIVVKKILILGNDENGKAILHTYREKIHRPKNGHELLAALRDRKRCEIVNTHAFDAAKALEDNNCGFSFSFKLSKINVGWALFERV